MNSTAFSPTSKSSAKIDENQITFGAVDFQPHPPTLAPVFANLDQEMDLTIGSFNFCVGSLGSVRLSEPINSDPSAGKTLIAATSETSVGSSSEVNSLVSMKPTKGKGSTIEELDEIMETLDLEESSGYSDKAFDKNLDNLNNYSEEDFTACYDNVSVNSEDIWKSGLDLYGDEQTIFSSGSNSDDHNQYQVYSVINETLEECDANNNPIINPENVRRGSNHMAEGNTEETIAARLKVQLTPAEWDTIKSSLNNGAAIPNRRKERSATRIPLCLTSTSTTVGKGKSEIRRRRESVSAVSKAFRAERSNASHTNIGRHHKHGSRVDNLKHADRRSLSRNLDSSFLSVNERGNIIPKTPEAVQAYLFTTPPTPRDPRESMHRAALQGLGLVGNRFKHRDEAPCRHVSPRYNGGTRKSRSLHVASTWKRKPTIQVSITTTQQQPKA
jgi:hypothetical protein